MARHLGGIFSRASGTTSGIVFSEVRDKKGKTMISREKVIPQDPQTTNQLEQRNRFSRLIAAITSWSPALYQELFDRSVRNLPGFQSLESALNKSLGNDGKFVDAPDIATGNQYGWTSGTIDFGVTNAAEITVTIDGDGQDYPVGTTLHAFAWIDFDGDWRTVDDTQFIYEKVDQAVASDTMSITLSLEDDLIDEVSDSLVSVLVQYPANSPRKKSRTRRSVSQRLEIQDMRSSGEK
jgi:hypothetical protein